MESETILVSTSDRERLLRLVHSARRELQRAEANIELLEDGLACATIVEPAELPIDVVTMGSTIWCRDLDSDEVEQYTVVAPAQADAVRDQISILAPLGIALLGGRLGDIVEWRNPWGIRRAEIVKVAQRLKVAKPAAVPVSV